MIDWIYILDILIVIIVLGYRGRQNGMLPESLFCFCTLISGVAAEENVTLFKKLIMSMPGVTDPFVSAAISYALIFIIIRAILAIAGLQIFKELRTTPFIEPLNRYVGIILGSLKAVILTSIILRFLSELSPFIPDITSPIRDNAIVLFFSEIIKNLYQFLSG